MRRFMSAFAFLTAFFISWPSPCATPVACPLEARFRELGGVFFERSGYMLNGSGTVLLPSREWIVLPLARFTLRPDHPNHEATTVGLLAINMESKKAIQLTWPVPQGDAIPPEFGVHEIVALGTDRCGIVLERYSNDDPEFSGRTSTYLYEWDVTRGEVRCVSPWEPHLTKLLSILDLSQCRLCWNTPRKGGWSGEARVEHLGTGSRARFCLNPEFLYESSPSWPDEGEWFAPADTPTSFLLCDSHWSDDDGPGEVELTCFDPLSSAGRRWNMGRQDFRSWLHASVEWLAPLPISHGPCARVLFYADIGGSNRPDFNRALLLIDTQTGAFVDCFPVDRSPFYPIVSPAGRRVVYAPKPWWEDRLLVLMDLERGETYGLYEFPLDADFARPIGFLNEHQFVAAGSEAIWLFECREVSTVTEVFRLDGKSQDLSAIAAEWRRTARFPVRKETWTRKPEAVE